MPITFFTGSGSTNSSWHKGARGSPSFRYFLLTQKKYVFFKRSRKTSLDNKKKVWALKPNFTLRSQEKLSARGRELSGMCPGEQGLSTWLSICITHPRATGLSRDWTGGNRVGRKHEPVLAKSGISSVQHSQHWTSPQRGTENKVRDESKICKLWKLGDEPATWCRLVQWGIRIWHLWHFAKELTALSQLLLAKLWLLPLMFLKALNILKYFEAGGRGILQG